MSELKQNFSKNTFCSGDRCTYASPEMNVCYVKLENDCLATGSVYGSGTVPDVNDPLISSGNGDVSLL